MILSFQTDLPGQTVQIQIRAVWSGSTLFAANSADPDQTAPRGAVWWGSTLFAIPSASFALITLW